MTRVRLPFHSASNRCINEAVAEAGSGRGSSRGRGVTFGADLGAEGEKCEPHWRHIVLFAAAYSICLKPQCGQSTLTFAGDEFATARLWRKVTKLEPRKRTSPAPPALHFGQPPDVPEPEQERQRPCWRHR